MAEWHRNMLIALAASLSLAACQQEGADNKSAGDGGRAAKGGDDATASVSILEALSKAPGQTTLVSAVKSAGLTETLSGSGPYTLFAPTDAAFKKLPEGSAAALLDPEGKARLTGLLTAHIVPGVVTAADLQRAIERGKGKAQLATLGGTTLTASKVGEAIVIADAGGAQARIALGDMMQTNGVVHSIDTVLVPK